MYFFVQLAGVLIRGSLCFVFLFIYHINIGVQGHPKSEIYAPLFIKPLKQMSTTVNTVFK